MKEVNSYNDLIAEIAGRDKGFLLLFKKGSEKSDCAFDNISEAGKYVKNLSLLYADVTHVRDIHERFEITTVPSLLEFRKEEFVRVIKGCNEATYYKAVFEDSVYHAETKIDGKRPVRITIYSTPGCSWCNTLKAYLKQHNIAYTDIDVSRDQKLAEALIKRSGQMGVPQTDINGEIIVGFNKPRINELLGIRG